MAHADCNRIDDVFSRAIRAGRLLLAALLTAVCQPVWAQQPPVHYLHAGAFPPGAIGAMQLLQRAPLAGYLQPVEIRAPQGAGISLAADNQFTSAEDAPIKVGMLVGGVYRLKVINIPRNEGVEVFPTLEIVDRLYPPSGMEARFAIPVELSQEELEFAMQGKFVTRVIYLENPDTASPAADDPEHQAVYEVGPQDKPVEVADRLGRPMVILRIGGRTPDDRLGPDAAFMFNSPPFQRYSAPADVNPPARPGAAPKRLDAQPDASTAKRGSSLPASSAPRKSLGNPPRSVGANQPVITATDFNQPTTNSTRSEVQR